MIATVALTAEVLAFLLALPGSLVNPSNYPLENLVSRASANLPLPVILPEAVRPVSGGGSLAMGPGGITHTATPPQDFGKELPHMDTLWVPVAREVPIRARDNEEVKWLLSGGEAEGAFLRELPQKHGKCSKTT